MAANVKTLPAPLGGLNAYDSIAGMPDTDAISMINLLPQAYGAYLRRGYQEFATTLGGDVQTLLPFSDSTGVERLYAFANNKLFNITAGGVAPAPTLTSLVSNVWQTTQFANSAGTHAIAFSGSDDGIWINLALGVQRLTLGDGIVNGTWKNVDPKNLIDVTVHQRRVWAVQKDTTYGWYLPVDQVYGVASKFDFGPLFKRGGYLQSILTWTVDTGVGSDDSLVAVSSNGEVAVYKGTDPATAGTWALQGVYYMGAPVTGRRFHTKVAGDIYFATVQGMVSLNTMLTSSTTTPPEVAIDSKLVQQPLSEAATALTGIFGWQMYYCAPFHMAFVNVPSVTSAGSTQFVTNTVNGKWCQFAGYDASHWVTFQGLPYFGSKNGKVYKGWYGHVDGADLTGNGGTDVVATVQQAYSYLGAPGVQKQIGMYRPTFLVASDVVYGSAVAYDFEFKTAAIGLSAPPAGSSRWDVGVWDQVVWSGSLKSQRQWSQAEGMGSAASFSYIMRSRSEALWVGTDFTYITGGVF